MVRRNGEALAEKENAFRKACGSSDITKAKAYYNKLIELEGNPKSQDEESNESALHHALLNSQSMDIVNFLVEDVKIDINEKTKRGLTPFLIAVQRGSLKLIRFLVDNGAEINDYDEEGNNALHLALASNPLIDVIKYLIQDLKFNANRKNMKGTPPFVIAASAGNLNAMIILIAEGANPYTVGSYSLGSQPKDAICAAACIDKKNIKEGFFPPIDIFRYLLNVLKFDINTMNMNGKTPFLFAVEHGNLQLMKFLVSKKANVRRVLRNEDSDDTKFDRNALDIAINAVDSNSNNIDIVEYLIDELKFSANCKCPKGEHPILIASKKGNLKLMKFLIQKGNLANKIQNKLNKYGNNALHILLTSNSITPGFSIIDTVKYLIDDLKMKLVVEGSKCEDYFSRAAGNGDLELMKFLMSKGVKINPSDRSLSNALSNPHIATEVLDYLIDELKFDLEADSDYYDSTYLFSLGNLKLMKYVTSKGISFNKINFDGSNAFTDLFIEDYIQEVDTIFDCVEFLVNEHKLCVNQADNDGCTPLMLAAAAQDLKVVKFLVSRGAFIHSRNSDGFNVFEYVIFGSVISILELDFIKYFVEGLKFPLNFKNVDYKGRNIFLQAIVLGKDVNVVKYIVEKGYEAFDQTDYDGYNAVNLAFMNEHLTPPQRLDLVKYLIEDLKLFHQISKKRRSKRKISPFLKAVKNEDLEMVKYLVSKGVSVNVKNKEGNNALNIVCSEDQSLIMAEYLTNELKFDVNERNEFNRSTPFLNACLGGNLPLMKLLVSKGANIYLRDDKEDDALDFLLRCPFPFCALEYLIDELKFKTEKQTPAVYLFFSGSMEALKFLLSKKVVSLSSLGPRISGFFAHKLKIQRIYNPSIMVEETIKKGNFGFLEELVSTGAPLDEKDEFLFEPTADTTEFKDLLECLQEGMWSFNFSKTNKDEEIQQPFVKAVIYGDLEKMKQLVEAGDDIVTSFKIDNEITLGILILATMYTDNLEVYEYLIDKLKVDINRDDNGATAFSTASTYRGNLDAMKFLVKKGAKVHATGAHILGQICWQDKISNIKEVIEYLTDELKFDVNFQDNDSGRSPFLYACHSGNLNVMKMLIQKKANINLMDKKGQNALHMAALSSSNDIMKNKVIEYLIDQLKFDVNQRDLEGVTPFLLACRSGTLNGMKVLIERKADIHACSFETSDEMSFNAFQFACGDDAFYSGPNDGKKIQYLINDLKFDINESTSVVGMSMFCYNIVHGNISFAKMLARSGADVDKPADKGMSPLQVLIVFKNFYRSEAFWAFFDFLVDELKMDVNQVNDVGENAVMEAVRDYKGETETDNDNDNVAVLDLVKLLVSKGANINQVNVSGNNILNILMSSSKNPSVELVKYLIDHGVDVNNEDDEGFTPFNRAAFNDNLEIMKLLYSSVSQFQDPSILKWFNEMEGSLKSDTNQFLLEEKKEKTKKNKKNKKKKKKNKKR